MIDILPPILNFGVVLAILYKFGKAPFFQFLADRKKKIESLVGVAQQRFSESSKELSHWENIWKSAPEQLASERKDQEKILETYKKQKLDRALGEAVRIQQEALRHVEAEKQKWVHALEREQIHQSIELARGFLEQSVTPQDQAKLVSENLQGVKNGHGG
jgi:F0F1-type ATP synthase membrane subunit b/b'